MQLKRVTDGGPGDGATSRRSLWESGVEAPSRWVIFCKFLEKTASLMTFESHFAPFQSHSKQQFFFNLKAN